jgi:lysine-N-methylase
MALPVRTLPVLQNWDCHVCGTCCKEYQVTVSDDERHRIEAQGWTRDELGGLQPFVRRGWLWNRRYTLNHRADGSCVFLSDKGRCRIHERHGYETKPLPCRLFPFVLVPTGDHWSVGVRFACPSAALNKGRAVPEHQADLAVFAARLADREGLKALPDGSLVPPPYLHGNRRLSWPDTHRIVDALTTLLRDRRDPMERRLRKCLTLIRELRGANLEGVTGAKLGELLDLLRVVTESETPPVTGLLRPGWVGRVLFRQAAALFTRKDHGPNRGTVGRGRLALLVAAWRFLRARGNVPRMHRLIPEATFDQGEVPAGPPPQELELALERYYTLKVGALQFCGPASFGLPLYEGFEALTITYPILMWVTRLYRDRSRLDALLEALTIVDDHIGFNRILAGLRQRLSFRILARSGQLARLIAWYSR